jgi:hypothetical protein
MKYAKPEVKLLASATEAIAGNKDTDVVDNGLITTSPAYQADE